MVDQLSNEATGTIVGDFFTRKTKVGGAKHAILQRYLNAYLPILSHNKYQFEMNGYTKIFYVDGFAGPGYYTEAENEEEVSGSPIIALQTALAHRNLNPNGAKIVMFFVEKDKTNAELLNLNLQKCIDNNPNAKNIGLVEYHVKQGTFVTQMTEILQEQEIGQFTPLLVFADPFGFSGDLIPMDLMWRILCRTSKAEIFVNVMDGFANRFFNVDNAARAINGLMGVENAEWRDVVHQAGPMNDKSKKAATARRNAFIGYYIKQLSKNKPANLFHLKFAMRNQYNRHKYHLVFIAQHPKAIKEMKRGMASASMDRDDFMFSEFDKNRGVVKQVDTLPCIRDLVLEHFAGKEVAGKDVEDFVWMETIYVFNKKPQLKKEFSDYITTHNSKFNDIIFKFPELEKEDDEDQYD